ncbi:unnamed protein product [Effrenium voratum]|uniref:Uncharacterized protein n=1 Tax=Effrenium voratum TaxID=2562239 RepID=A0AA36NK08_9DINO|nr:unnamed protein product [Effrenium voratum]CAJ1439071.1 unnamed protein product [Effrenium voratum]
MVAWRVLCLLLARPLAQTCPGVVEKDDIGPAMTCGVPCQLMELSNADQCRFDTSACGETVPAGTSCPVACRSPFRGDPALATCPPGNTDLFFKTELTAPDCDLFASDCPEGEIPEAYQRLLDGPGWECAPGYAGTATARCVPDENCQSTLQFFGCERTTACAPPINLIGCVLDVTRCAEIEPGGSCQVSCRFPYTGWSSVAVCRPDNVNPEVGLLVVEPQCTLTCEDPPNEPDGYIKVSFGNGWACAPGYGGEAMWECVIDSVCASKKVLSGCSLLARCILPVEDPCVYDFTECIGDSAAPGSFCKVHCKSPYRGNSTNASCPAGNTDPLRQLDWERPNCDINCGAADVPVGYLSHPYERVYGGWQCVFGYAGFPRVTCGTDANCNPQLQFSGCNALVPCDAPVLSSGELCAFQHTCISVRSGDSCEVTCRPPYVGGVANAECPPNNTLVGRQLIWAAPDCNLECPMPDPIPTGYVTAGTEPSGKQLWACAPYFEGFPTVTCRIGDGCQAAFEFQGCVPQTTCAVPENTPCSLDWSACQSVFAGSSCELACGPSFTGNVTEATCPEGNVDPTTPLEWTFPGCTLTCKDPEDPVGYVKSRFMCAQNYTGNPDTRCAADFSDSCNPTYSFSGCKAVVPCAAPKPGMGPGALQRIRDDADDFCMFDFSDCQSVAPGGNCTIRCGSDYSGKPTVAYCPSDNTDPQGNLIFMEPICALKPCGVAAPPGYTETPCGWVCDEGYIGEVEAYCSPMGTEPGKCRSELVIGGCTQTVQCAPLMVNDTCRTNVSQCQALQPGQGCNITCAEPYTGGQGENATWAYCPGSTTRLFQQPLWGTELGEWAIDCDVECALPEPIPEGYLLTGVWLCDSGLGYSGEASAECIVNASTCEPELIITGCFPTAPCNLPEIDACQHDVSACPSSLAAGTSCEVQCKPPYMTPLGEPGGSIACRDRNIDPTAAVWSPPRCILGCAEPSSQYGYRNVLGAWQCAEGFNGPGAIWSECVVDPASCVSFPRLFGCSPYVPCAPPDLTPIQSCMLDIASGNCEAVQPGEVCTVYCALPFIGDKLGAGCPATNIDPTRIINWAAPVCYCPVPLPVPEGYMHMGKDEYRCAEGFLGTANYRCDIDTTTCTHQVVLTGCYPLAPCDRPQVDDYDLCKLDFTNCQGPLEPGEVCNITCREGFNQNISDSQCPPANTVPYFSPSLDIYCGEYTCATADEWASENPLPKGYDVGIWRCTDGYRGSTSTKCVQSDECGGTLELSGCIPLQPCSVPRLSKRDTCRYNFTDCEMTPSGQFCDVHCVHPFVGEPGKAFCKPDNVDLGTVLEWVEPECSTQCAAPDPVPPGYVKDSCGWHCAPGYDGKARALCDVDDDCHPHLTLTGCAREEDCVVPSFDPCRFDFAQCADPVPPGASCQARCKAPYHGADFPAVCPAGNTIPGQGLSFDAERCSLTCPMPDPPPGYTYVGTSNDTGSSSSWSCAPNFVGRAVATCALSPNCGPPRLQLTGCDENVPCLALGLDQCQFSDCGVLAPGARCEIGCRWPYEGNSSVASCPDPNIDPSRFPDFEVPECSLVCPPLVVPANYTMTEGGIICAEGAVGAASVECRITAECQAYWHFEGCAMLVPCATPLVDLCRVDLGNCSDLGPGEFCIMGCRDGFDGGEAIGRCPMDNSNASFRVQLDEELACHCTPGPPQSGYELVGRNVDGGRWQCAADWTGDAKASCAIDEACRMDVTLAGCVPVYSCAAPDAAYLSDPADCQNIPAGETCEAQCAPSQCISGGPLLFSCPSGNTDASRPATWESGACKVKCEICRSSALIDTDPRPGFLTGTLQFGEAHSSGLMPVDGVHAYRLFFADECGLQLGPTLGYVPRSDMLYACCAPTAYSLRVEAEIPPNAVQMIIAINTSFGELPIGTSISYSDLTETQAPTTLRPITASCQGFAWHWMWMCLIGIHW